MNWNKENTLLLVQGNGFNYQGAKQEGYQVFHPFKEKGILYRLLRELFSRLPFSVKRKWYTEEVGRTRADYIVVWDAQITKDYLIWLRETHPQARIFFVYSNLIGKARHLYPKEIPSGIDIWTYDLQDSIRYAINKYKTHTYYRSFVRPLQDPEFDVFFVGRDKGRGEKLLQLEKQLKEMNLRTKIIITADGKFSRKKYYYQPMIPYSDVVEYLSKSKSVLDIPFEDQKSVTMRGIEAAFLGIKLITTNEHVLDDGFLKPENVFLLGKRELSELPAFLSAPVIKTDPELLKKNEMDGFLDEILGGSSN